MIVYFRKTVKTAVYHANSTCRTIDRNSNPICRVSCLLQKRLRAVATNSKVKPKVFGTLSKFKRKI